MAGSKIASATLTFLPATGVVQESEKFIAESQTQQHIFLVDVFRANAYASDI